MRRTLLVASILSAAILAADTPKRIVSMSPNLTELLYGIGAFDRVVGVSNYSTYPPEAASLRGVGQWHNPNYEKLIALQPDLVVVDSGQISFVEDKFKALGLRVVVAPTQTIEDIYISMTILGRATGHEREAAKLADATRAGLLRVAQKTAGLPKPGVVLIVDRTPGTLRDLHMATGGSFLAELVEIAGGRMAAPATPRGYAKLNKETLLAIDPDILLDMIHWVTSRFSGDPMEAWKEIPELKAVRARRVHGVNEEYVPHASQRIVQTAELFAKLIHPEAR
jgi:iron complex transport system substrate-binding protein